MGASPTTRADLKAARVAGGLAGTTVSLSEPFYVGHCPAQSCFGKTPRGQSAVSRGVWGRGARNRRVSQLECRPRKPAPGGGARRWVTRAWQGQAASDTRPQGSLSPAPTDEWTNRARCPHVCLFTTRVSSETPPQPPRTAPVWRSLWPPGHEQGRTRDLPTWNLLSPCFPGATGDGAQGPPRSRPHGPPRALPAGGGGGLTTWVTLQPHSAFSPPFGDF